MKKIIVLLVLALFAICGTSFAAELGQDTVTSATGLQIYGGVNAADAAGGTSVLLGKMSKGVNFRAQYATSGYAIGTKHVSGTKSYGTAHDSTAIYFQDVGQAGAIPSLTAADNTSFGTAWTSM